MPKNKPHEGLPPDSPSDVRPLPARPNLEFERKQAKKLLAALHTGDAEALARVRAKLKQSANTKPDEFQLSDAQFAIAREYGFSSWPKLVEYFETLAIHELSGQSAPYAHERLENSPRWILRSHAAKLPLAAAALSRFVPRFYGRSAADVFASALTTEDAQLVTARMHKFPSWQAYMESVRPDPDRWRDDSPLRRAFRAIRARDLDALKRLLAAHPELTHVTNPAEPGSSSVFYSVIHSDLRSGMRDYNRENSEWLVSTGLDLSTALNWLLLGFMRTETRDIQWLLDHGADPNWLPPNGIPVLEHAIYRYWNGEAVDLIAHRVKPREALWIAAGLGDVTGVKRYFDKGGQLTEAARNHRPDFTAMGHLPAPSSFGDSASTSCGNRSCWRRGTVVMRSWICCSTTGYRSIIRPGTSVSLGGPSSKGGHRLLSTWSSGEPTLTRAYARAWRNTSLNGQLTPRDDGSWNSAEGGPLTK
jgi:hypothetical protein